LPQARFGDFAVADTSIRPGPDRVLKAPDGLAIALHIHQNGAQNIADQGLAPRLGFKRESFSKTGLGV
jgi:hypothetical protein